MAKKKAARKAAPKTAEPPPATVRKPKQEAAVDQALDRIAWQKQIADELGVTVESVREWSQRPGFPSMGTADQVAAWRKVHIRSGGPPTVGQRKGIDPFTAEGLRELEAEKAQSVVLKNQKTLEDIIAKRLATEIKRKNLISLPMIESILRKFVSRERSEMESWPSKVITSVPGKDRQIVHDILAEEVRLKLVRLAAMQHDIIREVLADGS